MRYRTGLRPAVCRVVRCLTAGWKSLPANATPATTTQTDAAAGVLDSKLGRLVSPPCWRRPGAELCPALSERACGRAARAAPTGLGWITSGRYRQADPSICARLKDAWWITDNDDDHGGLDALDFSAAHTNEVAAGRLERLRPMTPKATWCLMRSPGGRGRSWSC